MLVSMSEEEQLPDLPSPSVLDQLDRLVLEKSSLPKVVTDEYGRIIRINEQFRFVFGYTELHVIGEGVELLLPEELRERHKDHVHNFFINPFKREMGGSLELLAQTRNGSKIRVKIYLVPIVIDAGRYALAELRILDKTGGPL